jgi:hypothetical protein
MVECCVLFEVRTEFLSMTEKSYSFKGSSDAVSAVNP